MVERNASAIKVVSRKSLCFFFTTTTLLFIMSWLFVLRSTRSDSTQAAISQLISTTFDNSDSESSQSQNSESSFNNRAILVNTKTQTPDIPKCNTNTTTSNDNNSNNSIIIINNNNNNNSKLVLKVFMYDLPPEFHFGLLDWKGDEKGKIVWPDMKTNVPHYPGGLNLQHSIEYWLTLDILASEFPETYPNNARTVIRVKNSSDADVIFVPFFSSLTYNRYSKTGPHEKRSRNKVLQEKLVRYLMSQEEWKRSGGRDHLILAHHPNSMLDARMKLWPATFILSDFGRYPPNIANVEKDVIAPYKHVVGSYVDDQSTFDTRKTLLYFQGAIYRKDVCYFLLPGLIYVFVFLFI
jgi:hypothetical protein